MTRPFPALPRGAVLLLVLAAALVAAAAWRLSAGDAGARTAGSLPLQEVARVPLSGAPVRFDYTSIDASTGTLWIAHMNASKLLGVSLKSWKITHTIDAPGVHGVIAVPEIGRVYASATNAQQVLTLDAASGKVLNHAPAGRYPDGLAWDPVEKHVFISDESGGVETVIDQKGDRIATIDLGGEAGNVQYDAGTGMVLADVQTRNDIAVIDPRTNKVVRRIGLQHCESDHSLLVDSPRRLAFVACEGNATLLTLELPSGRIVGVDKVGGGPDVLSLDTSLHRLYVSAESGVVGVFQETAHGARSLGVAFLADAAHTVAADPATHLVYFPLERGSHGGPQLLVMKPTGKA